MGDMETGQFCFQAVNPFGLEFNNSAETFKGTSYWI